MRSRFTWPVAAVALLAVFGACEQGTMIAPERSSSDDLPASPLVQQDGLPVVSHLGVDPATVIHRGGETPLAARPSSATQTVYSTLDGSEAWPVSIGYQASGTWESGDYVRASQPGVVSAVHVGLSSWACESGSWHTGDCSTSTGATFSHPITLNLYGVDYSGTDPAPGAVIYSKTVTFDLPYRPSADNTQCTGDDAGKFYDDRFGACVNGYNTTITFDFTSDDVVIPSEFMYGIEYNTQIYGPSPIGSPGPYNSLNFAFIDKTASAMPVLVGEDVEDGDLLWEASGVPFDLYDFGGLTDWPFTGAIQVDVTLEGHVTGGGWFTSPSGAYMPSDATVVTEADIDQTTDADIDWLSFESGTGDGTFAAGPGTPPLGSGSFHMASSGTSDKVTLFNYDHIGTLLADIESITYATYRSSSSTNGAAQYPAINIQVDYVGDGSSFTTLVWEPIYAYGQSALMTDTWQTWNTMAPSQTSFGGGWWSTSAIPGVCAFSCFVSWDDIVTNNPNARIKYGFGVNIGSGWANSFSGAVDALGLTVNGASTTYDFEAVTPPDPTGRASFGFVSRYKRGATVPSGNTQFTFKAADLDFHSSAYEWLVVNQGGSNAQFKGTGTINNLPSPMGEDYKFMVWAGDGSPDTFRIKIYYENGSGEQVVYDNGTDQPIEGGQIVVHSGK